MPVPLKKMQRWIANASVTPSAVRGRHGGKGVMHAAIEFLSTVDIAPLVDAPTFPRLLDETTNALRSKLPSPFQFWGTARKCLNIFLREASYNALLRETFELHVLDPVLETPLDRYVAEGLKRDAGLNRVPPWKTIIGLEKSENEIYQIVAAEIAREKYHTYRANLDLWYFRPISPTI